MVDVNRITLVGRVGQTPEVMRFEDGNEIATFSVATSQRWKDSRGEWKERTQWHRVVVKAKLLIEPIRKSVEKGSKLFIEGALEYRTYNKGGQEKLIAEIIVGPFGGALEVVEQNRKNTNSENNQSGYGHGNGRNEGSNRNSHAPDISDDEIPF